MKDFRNKVALITGAASGIGLSVAQKLISQNAKVVLLDLDIERLRKEFGKFGSDAALYRTDITDEKEVLAAVQDAIYNYDKIHILVNCAGVVGVTNIKSHEVRSEDLQKVVAVNFFGSFYASKAVLPYMIDNRYGRILHIASIAGKEGNAGMLAYSASKAAVIGMAKTQGKDYAEMGITVNSLAPAVIRTPLVDAMPEAQVKYMTDKIPMKRCGTLDEIANLVCFIVSEENSFTTGFTYDFSGGRATY